MIDITLRWAAPSDAGDGSEYVIERTLNNVDWTSVAIKPAVSPYVSVTGALASDASYGASQVALSDASSFPTSGYLWLDEAMVEWTGKSGNNLTGCTWHSGYGIYASGSSVYVANESYTDEAVTISLGAAVYRVTHSKDFGSALSAPTYIWYYSPPVPISSRHCVVVVNIGTDLGIEARSGLGVQAHLTADTEFAEHSGAHLDKAQSAAKTQTTNAFGLTFFHCWKNSARRPITGNDAGYVFVLDSASVDKLTVTVNEIPDRDWVLLNQIATSSS